MNHSLRSGKLLFALAAVTAVACGGAEEDEVFDATADALVACTSPIKDWAPNTSLNVTAGSLVRHQGLIYSANQSVWWAESQCSPSASPQCAWQAYTRRSDCGTGGGSGGATGSGGTGGTSTGGTGGSTGGTGGTTSSGGSSSGGSSSGGSSTGGSSTGGSGGGSGGSNACATDPSTCIVVGPTGPYGSKTFVVPAQQNWVNTGLYLRAGQTATITSSGTWSVTGTGSSIDHGPCKVGALVARMGLHYKDTALTCVGASTNFTAPKDGILFLGALAGNDLGETYETRHDDSGQKTVTVTSSQNTVPTVQSKDAASYPFSSVSSGWVEVWGKHVILTLPAAKAALDANTLLAATNRLDAIYDQQEILRGAVPHGGQRLRFFPDGTQPGYMLAGNPIRMDLDLVNGGATTRISRSGEAGTGVWGFGHEMGHDFSFAPDGFWTYQDGSKSLESWPNIFTIYSFEKLGLPLNSAATSCTRNSTGSFSTWDAWGGLCFLRQFQLRCGWNFYENFFDDILDETNTGGKSTWKYVYDKFVAAKAISCSDPGDTALDVAALFDAWGVPR